MKTENKQKSSEMKAEISLKPCGKPGPLLSVVIPTYKRGAVLEKHVTQIREVLLNDSIGDRSVELILVDDHSPDDTATVIRTLSDRWPEVKGILLSENAGQQNATLAGLRLAAGQVIVTMDDDLKDDPRDVRRLLAVLAQGYDLVYGVPACSRSASWLRRLGTALKESILARSCRKPKQIQLTAFRAMTRETVDRVARETRQHVYVSATILQEPVKVGQIPVRASRSDSHASGYSLLKLLQLLFRLTIQYGRGPLFRRVRKTGRQYEILEVIGCD